MNEGDNIYYSRYLLESSNKNNLYILDQIFTQHDIENKISLYENINETYSNKSTILINIICNYYKYCEKSDETRTKFIDIVTKLLNVENILDEPDENGNTALIYSSQYGYLEIVKLLLTKFTTSDDDAEAVTIYISENSNYETDSKRVCRN